MTAQYHKPESTMQFLEALRNGLNIISLPSCKCGWSPFGGGGGSLGGETGRLHGAAALLPRTRVANQGDSSEEATPGLWGFQARLAVEQDDARDSAVERETH